MTAPPLNVFAGNTLDRAADRRSDADWLAARLADPQSRALVLWNGEALVREAGGGAALAWPPLGLVREAAATEEHLAFLGLDGERAVFAFDLEGEADPTAGPLAGHGRFLGLREFGARSLAPEVAMAATAKALFEWRRRHRFCANCGAASEPADAGWKRVCPVCKAEHFPRTDPVVIMLPVAGERCLLGRNVRFPPGRFSTLAGFVEPGETIEEACAREMQEEAGLTTLSVRYWASQPWPFPSQLMVGLIAEVAQTEVRADQTELAEVRWFTRPEARALLEGRIDGVAGPPAFAIAHQLIRGWAYGG
jgi:NAD+ diphosphatase